MDYLLQKHKMNLVIPISVIWGSCGISLTLGSGLINLLSTVYHVISKNII